MNPGQNMMYSPNPYTNYNSKQNKRRRRNFTQVPTLYDVLLNPDGGVMYHTNGVPQHPESQPIQQMNPQQFHQNHFQPNPHWVFPPQRHPTAYYQQSPSHVQGRLRPPPFQQPPRQSHPSMAPIPNQQLQQPLQQSIDPQLIHPLPSSDAIPTSPSQQNGHSSSSSLPNGLPSTMLVNDRLPPQSNVHMRIEPPLEPEISIISPPSQMQAHEFTILLHRKGFGFSIDGGVEGKPISIGHILPGYIHDGDCSISSGDEILKVDHVYVHGQTIQRVVDMVAEASLKGSVILTLRRPVAKGGEQTSNDDVLKHSIEVHCLSEFTISRNEDEGFGFEIIPSGGKTGSIVSLITEDGPAHRCGKLHIGDQLLAINSIDVTAMYHCSIVDLVQESESSIALTVGPPKHDITGADKTELLYVKLDREDGGFGFNICGGEEFHRTPIFVLAIIENAPAAKEGRLRNGDQLIEINGQATKNVLQYAEELIKQSGSSMTLTVLRGEKIFSKFKTLEDSAALGSLSVEEYQALPDYHAHDALPGSEIMMIDDNEDADEWASERWKGRSPGIQQHVSSRLSY